MKVFHVEVHAVLSIMYATHIIHTVGTFCLFVCFSCFPALLFGLITIALAFMVSEMKNSSLFQITQLVAGIFLGPIGGVFFLGVLVPWANTPVSMYPELTPFTSE